MKYKNICQSDKYEFMEDAFMNKLLMFEPIDTSLFGDFVQILAIKRKPYKPD